MAAVVGLVVLLLGTTLGVVLLTLACSPEDYDR